MRVLIVGGTAFIGPHVVTRLHDDGHEVAVLHRGQTEAPLPEDTLHIHCPSGFMGCRDRLAEYMPAITDFNPNIVLDMIPVTEGDARTVMDLFHGLAQRVVAISSQDVYKAYGILGGSESGPPVPIPLTEEADRRTRYYPYRADPPRTSDDPRRWMDDYDKILVEDVVLGDPDLPGTVLRLPMVYGPGDRQRRMTPHLKPMTDGRPLILLAEGMASWRWTRGYVENVAAAIALAVTDARAAGRIYNIGEEDALTMREWITAIGRGLGWNGRVVTAPLELIPPELHSPMNTAQDLVTDSARIRSELGYSEPVSREDAIARTVAWECDNLPADAADNQSLYDAEDRVLRELERRREP